MKKILLITGLLLSAFTIYFLYQPTSVLTSVVTLLGMPVELTDKTDPRDEYQWYDDYYAVKAIDEQTFAITEPRYWQKNISYLILGEDRGVLFDSGNGKRDILAVATQLTDLPITIAASHLHYDHIGAMGKTKSTAMIDVPSIRDQMIESDLVKPTVDQHLGGFEGIKSPTVNVSEWWQHDQLIDLGSRQLRVLHAPGHTPDSIVLLDESSGFMFAGDFIYPGQLVAILPGADLGAYLSSAEMLATIPGDRQIFPGHGRGTAEPWQASVLGRGDLQQLAGVLAEMKRGEATSTGFYPRVFAINERIDLLTNFSWNAQW